MVYSNNWRGLDQGVEHTWQPNELFGVLEILEQHSPFSWGDPLSPIYEALAARFSDVTWSSVSNGEFRPIFRRSNTWKKLGLIDGDNQSAVITKLGHDVLNGDEPIENVILKACSDHYEDGEFPFRVLASAFLEKPNEAMSMSDVANGIMSRFRPGTDDLEASLIEARRLGDDVPSNTNRRLRSMLRLLHRCGAIDQSDTGTWIADKIDALGRIVHYSLPDNDNDEEVEENIGNEGRISGKSTGGSRPSDTVRPIGGNANTTRFSSSFTGVRDPSASLLLLEKAANEHEETVHILANNLQQIGENALEDPFGFDVACNRNNKAIFEVKSWTQRNLKDQLRKGVAQLPEYRWRNKDVYGDSTKLFIVMSSPCGDKIDPDFIEYLVTDRGIGLLWADGESIVSHDGQSLQECLSI